MKSFPFCLPDENGKKEVLGKFQEKMVAPYFYSEDITSGCTKERNFT